MKLTLDAQKQQIILDLDTDEWDVVQWVQSKGSSRLKVLLSKLFADRARTMRRENALINAKKLEKLPAAVQAQIKALIDG